MTWPQAFVLAVTIVSLSTALAIALWGFSKYCIREAEAREKFYHDLLSPPPTWKSTTITTTKPAPGKVDDA